MILVNNYDSQKLLVSLYNNSRFTDDRKRRITDRSTLSKSERSDWQTMFTLYLMRSFWREILIFHHIRGRETYKYFTLKQNMRYNALDETLMTLTQCNALSVILFMSHLLLSKCPHTYIHQGFRFIKFSCDSRKGNPMHKGWKYYAIELSLQSDCT